MSQEGGQEAAAGGVDALGFKTEFLFSRYESGAKAEARELADLSLWIAGQAWQDLLDRGLPYAAALAALDLALLWLRSGRTAEMEKPQPGDQIPLFDYTGPVDRDDILYAPRLDQIFFQGQNGSPFIPAPLKDTPDLKTVRSLAEVVDRLRELSPIL